jgi:hypothetical protein
MRGEGEHAAFSWWAFRAASQGPRTLRPVKPGMRLDKARHHEKKTQRLPHCTIVLLLFGERACRCSSGTPKPGRPSEAKAAQQEARRTGRAGRGKRRSSTAPPSAAAGCVQTTPAEGGEDPRGSEGRRVSFRAAAQNHRHRAACGVERPEHPRRAGASDARDERSECHRRRPAEAGRVPAERTKRSGAKARRAQRAERRAAKQRALCKARLVYLWFFGLVYRDGLYLWLLGLFRLRCCLALHPLANRWGVGTSDLPTPLRASWAR